MPRADGKPTTTERGLGWDFQKVAGPIRRRGVGSPCPKCGVVMVADYRSRFAATVDHVVPRILGGTNDPSNLVAVCRRCNCRAGQHLSTARKRARVLRAVQANPSRQW